MSLQTRTNTCNIGLKKHQETSIQNLTNNLHATQSTSNHHFSQEQYHHGIDCLKSVRQKKRHRLSNTCQPVSTSARSNQTRPLLTYTNTIYILFTLLTKINTILFCAQSTTPNRQVMTELSHLEEEEEDTVVLTRTV